MKARGKLVMLVQRLVKHSQFTTAHTVSLARSKATQVPIGTLTLTLYQNRDTAALTITVFL